ncbi:MAG: tetratricopeptide repeat protein [Candidatus Latescibacteria bacterium]|nr:tetratricopeptide repeat protein [Candidatus Latescibacterota bacterium]
MIKNKLLIIPVFVLTFLSVISQVVPQDDDLYGRILSISEKNVNVSFGNRSVGVGEEIEFLRITKIVDPVDGNVRGETKSLIAKGIVDDLGVGRVRVTITEIMTGGNIQMTDRARSTGVGKQIIRKQKIGSIQELQDDGNIVIDLGAKDEISEGDEFLIQRVETVIDPETKELTVTNQVDVGKGKVRSVEQNKSVGSMIELAPGKELLATDTIVFNLTREVENVPVVHDQTVIDSLRYEINDLKQEVSVLKATIDSLGYEHVIFKNEIESVLSQLMSGDIRGTRIVLKNDEPVSQADSKQLFDDYKIALDNCLNHKFKSAIEQFSRIIDKYPGSKLTENCRYWIAQSYFTIGNYTSAEKAFMEVILDTKFKHKDDDASIMLGITYFKMDKIENAMNEFKKFTNLYPKSEYIKIVERWLLLLST